MSRANAEPMLGEPHAAPRSSRRTWGERVSFAVVGLTGALAATEATLKAAPWVGRGDVVSLADMLELPEPALWALMIGLPAVGFWAVSWGTRRYSRPLQPLASRLRTGEPAHLKGRQDDRRNLAGLCQNHRLVFLVGESGVGKSALVRAGLCCEGKLPGALVPIVLDGWGGDWAEGPTRMLIGAIRSASSLTEEDRNALDLPLEGALPELLAALERLKSKRARVPLLIFDQFDDYLADHRDGFRAPETGAWKQPEQVVAENPFWQAISDLLKAGSAHALFVTRSDMASGLDSVRFLKAETYPLDRPRADEVVLPLLAHLTRPDPVRGAVIRATASQWRALAKRLARDLQSDGRVLPVQFQMAILGLSHLRRQTVATYERAGGVCGLEVRALEAVLGEAKRASGLDRRQISVALRALVDVGGRRPIRANLADLACAADVNPVRLERALRVLEQQDVIRVVGAREGAQASWRLAYDEWCRPVVALESRLNAGSALLHDAHQAWRGAGGNLIARWRALLTPRQQLRLLVQCVRGRCAFGRAWGFALVSTLRWLPLFVLIGLGYATYYWDRNRRDVETAERLFAGLRPDQPIKSDKIERIAWPLASASEAVRWRFLESALKDGRSANRIVPRIDVVLQAAVGTDSRFRERVINDLLAPKIAATKDSDLLLGCVFVARALYAYEDHPVFRTRVVQRLVQVIPQETDSRRLDNLSRALASVGAPLNPEQAGAVADRLAQALEKETDRNRLASLPGAFARVGAHLEPEQASKVVDRLVRAVEQETGQDRLAILSGALAAVGPRLKPKQVAAAADRLVQALEKDLSPDRADNLLLAFGSVCAQLNSEQAAAAADRLVQAITQETDGDRLDGLSVAFASVGKRLESEHAGVAADRLVQAITQETDGDRLESLTRAFAPVRKHLKDRQAAVAVDRLEQAIETETDSNRRDRLLCALLTVSPHCEPKQAGMFLYRLAPTISQENDTDRLAGVSAQSAPGGARSNPEQDRAAAERLAQAIAEETDSGRLASLSRELAPVCAHLKLEQARSVADRLVTAIEQETSRVRLVALSGALASVGANLKPEQKLTVAEPLVEALARETDRERLASLSGAFVVVGAHLEPKQAAEAADRLAHLIDMETDRDRVALSFFWSSDRQQIAFVKETDKDRLASLSYALAPVGAHLRPELARVVADHLAPMIARETDKDRLASFSYAFASGNGRRKLTHLGAK